MPDLLASATQWVSAMQAKHIYSKGMIVFWSSKNLITVLKLPVRMYLNEGVYFIPDYFLTDIQSSNCFKAPEYCIFAFVLYILLK